MSVPTVGRPQASLQDRYVAEHGDALLSGVQALVRTIIEVRRADIARGLRTAAFVSGYQGSPLGTLDLEIGRARPHLDPIGVTFRPGLNEELAATAVAGTQAVGTLPGRRVDGVTGFWYGKNPGLDRAADAIRHGNISGTAPLGGAVALIGDDPASKSSSVPSACEPMARSLMVPVLAPSSVEEIVTFGLHAVALSRAAGTWAGLKIVTDLADASQTVDLDAIARVVAAIPPPEDRRFEPPMMLPPRNLDAEHDLMVERLRVAREYVTAAGLNHVGFEPAKPTLALVGSGFGGQAIVRALGDLGLGEDELDALGIRVVQVGVPWPVDRTELRRLCGDVEDVLVVEDKLPFLEPLIRDALYGAPRTPSVVGKSDREGRPLLPSRSFVTGDDVALAIARVVGEQRLPARARTRLDELRDRSRRAVLPMAARTPYFCSGCPHNVSTQTTDTRLVGVGIGCHTMVLLDGGDSRGSTLGLTQMGGEGAQWIGMAPFTEDRHIVQNLGDGTFHHSGSLAIRAAVAAGVSITYKLLYNDVVAMTGGQDAEGKLSVPAITRLLVAEGVARVVVTTPTPDAYRGVALAPEASVRHRDDLAEIEQELSEVPGVTVLIHDDQCATEKRRLRKRGKLPMPAERIAINERVCEGCGDCGVQSTCMSVVPVQTAFGRKTQVHQSSCNLDRTCTKGDCPSFLVVTPAARPEPHETPAPPDELPDPERRVSSSVRIRMPGVGGTGVVTVSAILQMAAHVDGLYAGGLEQIGLAQKGGPVVSDLHLSREPVSGQLRHTTASVDLLLGLDLLGAATPETLGTCRPGRTVAVLNRGVAPTAAMVTDVRQPPVDVRRAVDRVARATDLESLVAFDALALAERLFGDHMPANMLLVGAAYQHGCLPLRATAIERAIELNGAAVDVNLAAFRWGRAVVGAPETVPDDGSDTAPVATEPWAREAVERSSLPGALHASAAMLVSELARFQDRRYAMRFLRSVEQLHATEAERTGGEAVTDAFMHGLFKLMAYKDEYEVARLHLDEAERAKIAATFGTGARVKVLLHPPLLRAMGLQRKIELGRSAFVLFRLLRRMRRLRGTWLDPFGYAEVRRVERALPGEYEEVVRQAVDALTPDTESAVVAVARLTDEIRGYEEIKLRNVRRVREQASAALQSLAEPESPPTLPVTVSTSGTDR